jgi:hypothetical protein
MLEDKRMDRLEFFFFFNYFFFEEGKIGLQLWVGSRKFQLV